MSTQYPLIPSHVSVQSFVTVKLSDKCMYGLWKTQMLCLLKSHDMLGFIDESSPLPPVGDHEHRRLWNRLDALVHGWILGSLSEQAAITVLNHLKSKHHQQTHHVTAKHIWDQLQSMYGQQAAELEEERKGEGCDSTCIDLMNKMEEERDISRNKKALYHAVECGMLQEVVSILKKEKIRMTDCISINGNTALHIAVTYSSDSFLKSMLNLLPSDIPLKDVRNEDGSTPLHLAVSLGNTNAAKILLDRCQDLLYAKDNEGCTPLDIVLSRPWKKEMCRLLMNSQTPDIEQANTTYAGHEPLVNAIAYRHFDLALTLIQRCNSLKSRAVLMAIAQNCPTDFTPNELITYELFQTPVLEFINRGTSNMKSCMKLANLVLRAVLAYPYKMLIQIGMKLQVLEDLRERMNNRGDAKKLLNAICYLIIFSKAEGGDFYREAMLEAIRRDASDVVEIMVHWFPEAALMLDEDGHNIAQAAWKNRASKVYALILDSNLAKRTSLSHNAMKQQDECGNNFLHFAARLAPAKKTDLNSWPPFRMQRELQWFKLAQDMLPQGRMEKNSFGETPEMVFKKEHKDLEIESRDWIKSASNAVAITSTLIITVMFAAAIQVPGGNGDIGLPNMSGQPAFIAFETSITISAMASCLSLLLFLGILTSPLPPDHFLLRLPLALVTGLVSLFVSVTFGMLAFLAALILMFGTNDKNHHNHIWVLYFLTPLIALPISLFYFLYSSYVSRVLADFMHSTGHFLIIHAFRRLKLVGRILI